VGYIALDEVVAVGRVHALDRELLQAKPMVEIGGLVVSENSRGQGIGENLVDAVANLARERGQDVLWVMSGSTRVESHRFYESIGFDLLKMSMTFARR
jgi:ribosomal protein S18 acetylase RimI-like enzyme